MSMMNFISGFSLYRGAIPKASKVLVCRYAPEGAEGGSGELSWDERRHQIIYDEMSRAHNCLNTSLRLNDNCMIKVPGDNKKFAIWRDGLHNRICGLLPDRFITEKELPKIDTQIEDIVREFSELYVNMYRKYIDKINSEDERKKIEDVLQVDLKKINDLMTAYRLAFRMYYMYGERSTIDPVDAIQLVMDGCNVISYAQWWGAFPVKNDIAANTRIKGLRFTCVQSDFYLLMSELFQTAVKIPPETVGISAQLKTGIKWKLIGKKNIELIISITANDNKHGNDLIPQNMREDLLKWGFKVDVIGDEYIVRIPVLPI